MAPGTERVRGAYCVVKTLYILLFITIWRDARQSPIVQIMQLYKLKGSLKKKKKRTDKASKTTKHLKKSNAACFYTPIVLKLLVIVQM